MSNDYIKLQIQPSQNMYSYQLIAENKGQPKNISETQWLFSHTYSSPVLEEEEEEVEGKILLIVFFLAVLDDEP